MKNINYENNKEEPLWFSIMMWTIVTVLFIGFILIIDHFMPKEMSPAKKCEIECNKFEMDHYKVDWHSNNLNICWCLNDDGKPRSIGGV